MKLRERKLVSPTEKSDRIRPKVITWKGVPMVRHHSFMAAVQEIVDFNDEIDVVRIGLIGDMHSGKSTLARAISHVLHKKSKHEYVIRILHEKELMNFQDTLETLVPANHILIFDDVSFMGASSNKKQVEMVKQAVTKIRHLEGGKDVKIAVIMNYHYTFGLDKYLRMADFRFFLTVGSSETENMEKIMGSKYNNLIKQFKTMRHQAVVKKIFSLRIGPKEIFTYKFRNPFIPLIFFNEQRPRLVVSPTREFIDPICSVCSTADNIHSEIPIEQFIEEAEGKFNPQTLKAAIKQKLREIGLDTYSARFIQARRYIEKAMEMKVINLEDLAVYYGMTQTKTKLKKKLDGVLIDVPD